MIKPPLISLMLLLGAPSIAVAASFDCDKAATETEVAICANPELSALDELMGALWVSLNPSESVVAEQRAWLEQREDCGVNQACTATQYKFRFQEFGWEIRGVLDHGQGKPEYFLYTQISYAYQSSAFLYRAKNAGDQLVTPSIFIPDPQFLEGISSCNKGSINSDISIEEMPFEDVIGVWLNPDINITADVSAYIKWAGHGDQSHSVSYHLIDGEFIPSRIFLDSCLDQAIQQIELIFSLK